MMNENGYLKIVFEEVLFLRQADEGNYLPKIARPEPQESVESDPSLSQNTNHNASHPEDEYTPKIPFLGNNLSSEWLVVIDSSPEAQLSAEEKKTLVQILQSKDIKPSEPLFFNLKDLPGFTDFKVLDDAMQNLKFVLVLANADPLQWQELDTLLRTKNGRVLVGKGLRQLQTDQSALRDLFDELKKL
ncbi:MAG: hypothetical protein LAT68_09850 [Cyclobacteriaceae bacterium]|nr:hypothetical protein [Cyclobacteriaceae bacterium]MCH8516619.1 hypothetical protein [Cyclobacteriaceae bacterium]